MASVEQMERTVRRALKALVLFFVALAVAMIAWSAFAQEAKPTKPAVTEPSDEDKAAFFFRMGRAKTVADTKDTTTNCCGPADWTLVRVLGARPEGLLVQVTDSRRHRYAKVGSIHVVPRSIFVLREQSPWGVPGLFLSDTAEMKPYCFVGTGGG